MDKTSNSPKSHFPIGVFDSGVGGLTVLKAIGERLPHENIIYLGDTARLPYGNRSGETVKKYVKDCIEFLLRYEIKALVVACNTATAHAGEMLKEMLPIPVIGVVEPGVEKVTESTKNRKIGVIATKGTLNTEIYQRLIGERIEDAIVHAIACPLFVPLVEEGLTHHALTRMAVKHYLESLTEKGIDTLLLGCTHYPLIKDLIREFIGNDVNIIDSASTCASFLEHTLIINDLLNTEKASSEYHYFVTDDAMGFANTAKKLHISIDPDKLAEVNFEDATIATYQHH